MEKADILEMAVKHLRQIQRQQVNDTLADKYSLGFTACAQEVSKYLDDDVDLKTKLLNHLANCINGPSCSSSSPSSSLVMETSSRSSLSAPVSPPSSGAASPSSTTLSPELQRSLHLDVKHVVTSSSMKNLAFSGLSSFEQRLQNLAVPQSTDRQLIKSPNKVNEFYASNSNVCSSSSENVFSVLVNGSQISASRLSVADINNNSSSSSGKSVNDASDSTSVSEVNNNSIIGIPTMIGLRETTALQQQQQLQTQLQIQPVQQIQPMSGISIHPHQQAILHDSSILTNRLQFLPIKTASGETAFVLSAANLVNPAQLSGYTFQVYSPQTQQQIFAQPFQPQQAVQIAVAFPQEEHQPAVTYIPQVSQPHSVLTGAFDLPHHAKSALGLFDNQSAPLNLTSSNPKPVPQPTSSRYTARTPEHLPSTSAAHRHHEQLNVSFEECPKTSNATPNSVYFKHSPVMTAITDADHSQQPTSSMSSDPRGVTEGSPIGTSLYQRHRLDYPHSSDSNVDMKPASFFRPW
ncbi:hypothetical protein Btru_030314 [Bulinus truncatus]|nr:hypothetical protein Btru_030314 [Bulinus truncatus]